jgi:hypothetical protein
VKRCPECSNLVPREQWLCDCGYEFAGNEPEATPTPEDIRSVAERDNAKLSQSHRTEPLTVLCIWVLLASFLALAVGSHITHRPLNATVVLVGFCGFTFSFFGLCRAVFRAARGRVFVVLGGIVLLLLGLISLALSAVTAACGFTP